MFPPEKIPLGNWLAQGGTVLHVDFPVVFWNLSQAVAPLDLIDDLVHFTAGGVGIFVTTFIDFVHSYRLLFQACRGSLELLSPVRGAGREREPLAASSSTSRRRLALRSGSKEPTSDIA